MNEINLQQTLIEQIKQITNNQELIDLAVNLVDSYQDVIRYKYNNIEVLFNTQDNTLVESDYGNFNDLLRVLAYNNIDKLTVTNACQYPDLMEGCVRYLYFSSTNVYYKITINQIKYVYAITKDSYKRYQEFWFNYLTFSANAWDSDDDRGLVVYGVKSFTNTTKNAELFLTERALLNKYKTALIIT